MNNKLSRWLAGAAATLLLMTILAACGDAPTASPGASAPTSAPAAPSTPAPTDLSKVTPKPFDQRMQAELEAYITMVMQREQVPGASVAIVQDGKVVYQQGFGVREQGKPDPVTPETLMMIGSTGKSMTTMMMASVIDDGKMTWDTPAVSILPTFALSDPKLTSNVTMRQLVCNCTGIERRDIEMYFPNTPRTAEGMLQGLRTFSFAGTFGKSYQYSNQMVASGGYLAARAATAQPSNLYDDYVTQMQRRVFDPIGMASTTFSFDTVQANPNHATPHGRTADMQLIPISLQLEQLVVQSVAPAGGAWSNVQDLARYLITQLNQGVAPDGRHVVSADNLKLTWQPQVQIAPNAWYGLGWIVGAYKGARMLSHSGGTSGFSSDLTFLPGAGLGIAILSNAQESTTFLQAVRARTLELAYGQPMEIDAILAKRTAEAQQAVREQLAQLPPQLDLAAVAPYQGIYTNPRLGEVTLALKGEKLLLDSGTFTTELRSAGNGTYLLWDPPLAGMQVQLDRDATGQPSWQLISTDHDQPGTYPFTQMQTTTVATSDQVVQWINATAHPLTTTDPAAPLDDLAPLKDIVGPAELVGLGEATHGSKEIWTMKQRMVEYLVERRGFTGFVMEVDWPTGQQLDDYVLHGTGDLHTILAHFPWNNQEVVNVFEWLRAYNADPQHAHTVRVGGMDVGSISPDMIDSVIRYLQTAAPDLLPQIQQAYAGLRSASTGYNSGYASLPQAARAQYTAQAQQVVDLLQQHESTLVASSSKQTFALTLQIARVIREFAQTNDLITSNPGAGFTYHDQSMAENAVWFHDQFGKSMIWAHDGHVAYHTMLPQAYPDKVMGTFLHERLGNRYMNIGTSFGEGTYLAINGRPGPGKTLAEEVVPITVGPPIPESSNAVLGQGGTDYLLDLRAAPAPVQGWLNEPRPFRIGTAAAVNDPQWLAQNTYPIGALGQWFDVLVQLRQVSAGHMPQR